MAGTARDFFEKSITRTFLPGDVVDKEEVILTVRHLEDQIRQKEDEITRRSEMAMNMEDQIRCKEDEITRMNEMTTNMEDQIRRKEDEVTRMNEMTMNMESELTLMNEQNEDLKRRMNALEEQHKKEVEEFEAALRRAADEAVSNRQPEDTYASMERIMQKFANLMFAIFQFALLLISESHEIKKAKGYALFAAFSGLNILCSIYGTWIEFKLKNFKRRTWNGLFWWFDQQNRPFVPLISLVEIGLGLTGFVSGMTRMGMMKGCSVMKSMEIGIAFTQLLTKCASFIRVSFRIHDR